MRVWFVSEVFDASGVTTGYYLARIADVLAHEYDVRVITDPKRGAHEGPRLEHMAASVTQRGIRTLLSSVKLSLRALLRMRRGDIVIAVTNPPALPILIALVARLRGTRLVIIVHDVYPDVLVAAKVWRAGGIVARVFDRLNRMALSRADRIVVIGRDMQRRLAARLNGAADRIEYIPNWANDEITAAPVPGSAARPLVVQYSGNMGVTHDVDTLLDAAALLRPHAEDIQIELIGWGLKLPAVRAAVHERGLHNVKLLPPAAREQLGGQLARCDVALILMIAGTAGASVPCRLYNVMAAARPVIVAADEDSEIATVVREHRLGWVVDPGAPEQLAAAILDARARAGELARMGEQARAFAASAHTFPQAASAYRQLVRSIA